MGRRAPNESSTPIEAPKAVNGDSKTAEDGPSTSESPAPAGPLTTAQRLAASNSATASAEVAPDAYAREAKHFTEVRVLHRDVSFSFTNLGLTAIFLNGSL
jgi:staphylococcal nuclease domain-containing protein 1